MPIALLDPIHPALAARRFPTGLLVSALALWAIVFAMIALSLVFPNQANGVFAVEMIGL